jgi:integrase
MLKGLKPSPLQYDIWDSHTPGFGVRVGATRKTFCALTRVDGKVKRITLGHYPAIGLAEARRAASQTLIDAQQGIAPAERKRVIEEERVEQQSTFGAVAEKFLKEHCANLRSRNEIRCKIEVELFPHWRERQIESITRNDIKVLAYSKAADHPVAGNRLLTLIGTIFGFATEEGYIQASPAIRIKHIGKEQERERVLTESEIAIVWDAMQRLGYPFGKLLQMSLVTAQRKGEVRAMRWRDISDNGWLIPAEHFKTGRSHHVMLSGLAREILESIPQNGQYVFHARFDAPFWGWNKGKQNLDSLCAEPVGHWTIHDLRRTAATHMRGLGTDRFVVSKILGHCEGGVTHIYDRHSADKEKLAALELWAHKLRSIIGALPSAHSLGLSDFDVRRG